MLPPPPPPPISTCVSVRCIHTCVCVYVCSRERDREGRGGYQSPQGVVAGGIHRSLLPLSDNSGVIQAGVGRAVLGPVMKHHGL